MRISRRSLLRGDLPTRPPGADPAPDRTGHVLSLVVHARADRAGAAARAIDGLRGAAVRADDGAGRLVVLLEAEEESRILDAFREMEALDGVLSVALVYHHCGDA